MIIANPRMVNLPHYVYKHYDADGRVLYIGCTHDPEGRFAAQRTSSYSADWWPLVAHTEVIGPMPYVEAFHAETHAIRADLPPYNKLVPPPYTLRELKRRLAIRLRIPIGRGFAA